MIHNLNIQDMVELTFVVRLTAGDRVVIIM